LPQLGQTTEGTVALSMASRWIGNGLAVVADCNNLQSGGRTNDQLKGAVMCAIQVRHVAQRNESANHKAERHQLTKPAAQ
jgi:hypothetical protein